MASDDDAQKLLGTQQAIARYQYSEAIAHEQLRTDRMPRPLQYQGYDADSGRAIVQPLGGQPVGAYQPITNGAIATGSAVAGRGTRIDAMPRPRQEEEVAQPQRREAIAAALITKIVNEGGTIKTQLFFTDSDRHIILLDRFEGISSFLIAFPVFLTIVDRNTIIAQCVFGPDGTLDTAAYLIRSGRIAARIQRPIATVQEVLSGERQKIDFGSTPFSRFSAFLQPAIGWVPKAYEGTQFNGFPNLAPANPIAGRVNRELNINQDNPTARAKIYQAAYEDGGTLQPASISLVAPPRNVFGNSRKMQIWEVRPFRFLNPLEVGGFRPELGGRRTTKPARIKASPTQLGYESEPLVWSNFPQLPVQPANFQTFVDSENPPFDFGSSTQLVNFSVPTILNGDALLTVRSYKVAFF